MRKMLGALSVAAMLAAASGASAAEATGTIESVDPATRIIILDNGVEYTLDESVAIDELAPGATVTVSFEEQGDKNMATQVTPAN